MIVLNGLNRVDQALQIRDLLRIKFALGTFEVEQTEPYVPEWRIVTHDAAITALAIYGIYAEGVAAGIGVDYNPLF
jgi:hypothetical protein